MAVKRMFSNNVIETDKFTQMSQGAQLLYFYLNMAADDDGFCPAPMKVMEMCKTNVADMEQLVTKGYVIWLDSGVMVIRHWLVHNSLKKATYHPTIHTDDKEKIGAASDGSYELLELLPSGSKSIHTLQLEKGDVPLSHTDLMRIGKGLNLLIEDNEANSASDNSGEIVLDDNCLYGPEKNILLLDDEYKKICETYLEPAKLITKVGYILMNKKSQPASHYAYINKVAIEDGWPLKKQVLHKESKCDEDIDQLRKEDDEKKIKEIMNENGVDRKTAEEMYERRCDEARDAVLARLKKGVID